MVHVLSFLQSAVLQSQVDGLAWLAMRNMHIELKHYYLVSFTTYIILSIS